MPASVPACASLRRQVPISETWYNLASSINIGAFNLGNAIGAALGGAVIGAGLGYGWVSVAGAAMAGGGFILVVLTRKEATAQPSRPAT